jgi:hypothetical protein
LAPEDLSERQILVALPDVAPLQPLDRENGCYAAASGLFSSSEMVRELLARSVSIGFCLLCRDRR